MGDWASLEQLERRILDFSSSFSRGYSSGMAGFQGQDGEFGGFEAGVELGEDGGLMAVVGVRNLGAGIGRVLGGV